MATKEEVFGEYIDFETDEYKINSKKEYYPYKHICQNCGKEKWYRIPKGEKTYDFLSGKTCPFCKCETIIEKEK